MAETFFIQQRKGMRQRIAPQVLYFNLAQMVMVAQMVVDDGIFSHLL
jgi:hypothetical protein